MPTATNSDILDFFSKHIEEKAGSSAREYNKAYIYLANFLSATDNAFVNPSEALLEDLCLILFAYGFTPKTVAHYFDLISALYTSAVKEGLVAPTTAFKTVKSKIKNGEFKPGAEMVSDEQFTRLHNLALLSSRLNKDTALYIDIFVVAILTGCRPLSQVAMMKKSDIAAQAPQVATILERYIEPGRRYVWPLHQSQRTPRQLERHVEARIVALFKSRGISIGKSVDDTACNYWAYTAMKCGITPSEILAVLGTLPGGMAAQKSNDNTTANAADKDTAKIIHTVSEAFMHNPTNWYAMKLRPRVKIASIYERLTEIDPHLRPVATFYPCTEILRKVNKKMVKESTPVLPDVLFFKSRMTDVRSLFAQIGDLAWCYRCGNGSGQYAIISRTEMEHFQRAIGQFSADYEVGAIGTLTPRQGDRIRVISGIFGGNEGELLAVLDTPEEGTIYRLKIIDNQGIEWRVGVDPRHTSAQ